MATGEGKEWKCLDSCIGCKQRIDREAGSTPGPRTERE